MSDAYFGRRQDVLNQARDLGSRQFARRRLFRRAFRFAELANLDRDATLQLATELVVRVETEQRRGDEERLDEATRLVAAEAAARAAPSAGSAR